MRLSIGAGVAPVVCLILAATLLGLSIRPRPAASEPLLTAPDGRRITLTFSDEFDSLRRIGPGASGQGSPMWRTTFGDGSASGLDTRTIRHNKELQVYADPDMADGRGRPMGLNPFSVHDGVLDLVAVPASPAVEPALGGLTYVSGMISSQPSFSQTYGYFEARVRLPAGKGLWPAVWMLPADQSWPPEIDIMESIGDPGTAYMTVHGHEPTAPAVTAHPATAGFHTFAVAWDSKAVIFYLDGVETARQPTPPDMHKPMFIVANLAIGGDWAGAPDAATRFPAKFSIDYIRAYRFTP